MLNGKKIVVVMPSYNAARTLARTVDEIPRDIAVRGQKLLSNYYKEIEAKKTTADPN